MNHYDDKEDDNNLLSDVLITEKKTPSTYYVLVVYMAFTLMGSVVLLFSNRFRVPENLVLIIVSLVLNAITLVLLIKKYRLGWALYTILTMVSLLSNLAAIAGSAQYLRNYRLTTIGSMFFGPVVLALVLVLLFRTEILRLFAISPGYKKQTIIAGIIISIGATVYYMFRDSLI